MSWQDFILSQQYDVLHSMRIVSDHWHNHLRFSQDCQKDWTAKIRESIPQGIKGTVGESK